MKPKDLQGNGGFIAEQSRRMGNYQSAPNANYRPIYDEAVSKRLWIYDPEIKRWQTPEEFKKNEENITTGDLKRYSRLKVKDPKEGIEAAFVQIEDLKNRMEIFVKRVLEYYRKK